MFLRVTNCCQWHIYIGMYGIPGVSPTNFPGGKRYPSKKLDHLIPTCRSVCGCALESVRFYLPLPRAVHTPTFAYRTIIFLHVGAWTSSKRHKKQSIYIYM